MTQRTIVVALAAVFLAAAVLAYYPSYGDDTDVWFHLRYGKHYVENRTWSIDHSMFSWTPSVTDWQYVTWLGSSALYLAYKAGGLPALYVLQWLVLAGMFALFLWLIRTTGDRLSALHLAGMLGVAVALGLTIVYIKPEIFSTLLFTATVVLYFHSKVTGRGTLFAAPAMFAVWVNAHGGFILGLMFLTLAAAGELAAWLLARRGERDLRLLRTVAIATALSFAAVLLNPYGLSYHLNTLRNMFSREYMGDATQLFAYANMWDHLSGGLETYRFGKAAWATVLMGASFVALCVWLFAKKRVYDAAVIVCNAAFFVLAMNTARATIFFPIVWLASSVFLIWRGGVQEEARRSWAKPALALLLLGGTNLLYSSVYYSARPGWFGSKANDFLPVGAVDYVYRHKLPGPMFNDYALGGYLMWAMHPDYKVFIDPRYGPYVKQVWPDWVRLPEMLSLKGLAEFTAKYPFKFAILSLREVYLNHWLLASPEWRLVFYDANASVIVHRSVADALGLHPSAAEVGAERFRAQTNPLVLMRLFNFLVNHDVDEARKVLDYYRQGVPDRYVFKPGDIAECESALQQALQKRRPAPRAAAAPARMGFAR